ncbi:MAG: hypothetical protein M1834_008544 [Cirrosporium novae-zelandiae]|nr:MAG: hypothetical protein M1834_008544 [Cirrosporium novae-zelandiae]
MSNSDDLKALFASLQRNDSRTGSPSNNLSQSRNAHAFAHNGFLPSHEYRTPSVSSPIMSPPANESQPHTSTIASPRTNPSISPAPGMGHQSSDRTASLLNLLKFSQPPASFGQATSGEVDKPSQLKSPVSHGGSSHSIHGRGVSASDLVASFMGKPSSPSGHEQTSIHSQEQAYEQHGNSAMEEKPPVGTENPQDLLLRLLNRTASQNKPESERGRETQKPTKHTPEPSSDRSRGRENIMPKEETSRQSSRGATIRVFGADDTGKPTPFEPSATKRDTIFTYVNPFEQLAASSPRNQPPRKDTPTPGIMSVSKDGNKRSKISSPETSSIRRNLSADEETNVSPREKSATLNGQAKLFHPSRLSNSTTKDQSVADALQEMGDEVNHEVEDALTRAERENLGMAADAVMDALEKASDAELDAAVEAAHEDLQSIAANVKDSLDSPGNKEALREAFPEPVARAVEEVVEEVVNGNVVDDWESAEEGPDRAEERKVLVFNFPMRPFVSIEIKSKKQQLLSFRDDALMDVARFKKDFDQIDRTLASATEGYVVYALPKSGFRVIRQDDGVEKQVFRSSHDRIFNIAISTAPTSQDSKVQAVIATGISGTVYWSPISDSETFAENAPSVESQSLVFPPVPAPDPQTSGGQLKTRARKSSRHPEFFAIGRGKAIHIVSSNRADPYVIGNAPNYRRVDAERFFKERTMKIATGKAGKDFSFSDDDSLIVSLDKAGRLRFWDIRALFDADSPRRPSEVKVPLWSLNTTSPTEKSWPTSVLFVDKIRPYSKEIALRYLLVGMKQNHTLQLWDLGLGKAVQELNFPHENESDAICSIAYHPNSGIIVVGHPTRNSIYFIHLSAPKYNLPAMNQAKFLERLADNDETLPKPEATAIMSGLREYSFAPKGELRSLELLPRVNSGSSTFGLDQVLFELYVAHSKGVTYVTVKKEDLGWSPNRDFKVLHPVDAEETGVIVVKELREPSEPPSDRSSANGEQIMSRVDAKQSDTSRVASPIPIPIPTKPVLLGSAKARGGDDRPEVPSRTSSTQRQELPTNSGVEKTSRRKKKLAALGDANSNIISGSERDIPPTSQTYASAARSTNNTQPDSFSTLTKPNGNSKPAQRLFDPRMGLDDLHSRAMHDSESSGLKISRDLLDDLAQKVNDSISTEISKFNEATGQQFNDLYRHIEEDRRVQDAAGAAKQDAVLRLISSTLSNNIEKSLTRIVTSGIKDNIVPELNKVVGSVINQRVTELLSDSLRQIIPRELKASLPEVINKAMQSREVARSISEAVTAKLSGRIDNGLTTVFQTSIAPAFEDLTSRVSQKISKEVERRVNEQLQQANVIRTESNEKIDQLMLLVHGLTETVHSMATTQSELQNEVNQLRSIVSQKQAPAPAPAPTQSSPSRHGSSTLPALELSEMEKIAMLMDEGKYDEGTVKWIQSQHPSELFDNFFCRYSPEFLRSVAPLVALSTAATLMQTFDTHLAERLTWLETLLPRLNPMDPEIKQVMPRILDALSQKLESHFMVVAETDPGNMAILRKIPQLVRQVKEIRSYLP